MYRVDVPTAVVAKPPYPAGGTQGFWGNCNPGAGFPGTQLDAAWFNRVQEELLKVITEAGLTPDPDDDTQLWQALQALFSPVTPGRLLRITTFTASGTWNLPADVGSVLAFVLGGGGGSGGGEGGASFSGVGVPGCGAGCGIKRIPLASLLATETVTIGAGGNGGVGLANGSDGGTSSFGAHVSALGGKGGPSRSGAQGTVLTANYVLQGGIGVGGDINLRGEAPNALTYFGDSFINPPGARGAGPYGGPGGRPLVNVTARPTNGVDAEDNTGGGGSPGVTVYNTAGSFSNGGNGGKGLVVLWEFSK